MAVKPKQPEPQERMENAVMLPRDRIYLDASQPRKFFDPDEMEGLQKSIKAHGILQPLIVTHDPSAYDGRPFKLRAGERRYRASDGVLDKLPCIISGVAAGKARILSLVENIQRKDLTALEEAHAIADLIADQQLSKLAAARELGKHPSWVDNRLNLLKTGPDVQAVAASRPFAISSLLLIDTVKDTDERRELLEAVENRASHSQIKQRIDEINAMRKSVKDSYKAPDKETHSRTRDHTNHGGGQMSRGRQLTTSTPQDAKTVIADTVSEIERHIRTLEAWKTHLPSKRFNALVGPLREQIEGLCE